MQSITCFRLIRSARPLLLAMLLFMTGCELRSRRVERGFYFWKTRLRLSAYEQQLLSRLGSEQLFVRLFDVDLDERLGRAVPIGTLQTLGKLPEGLRYTPVVFITQKALTSLPDADIDRLAGAIVRYSDELCGSMDLHPAALQIDYDWTPSTRDRYFHLLRSIRKQLDGRQLSVTLRMHQVRHFLKMGVPPADRGLLMCYNMGTMKKFGAHNSILDVPEAQEYLKQMEGYPLRLDVALPLFRWTLLYRHTQLRGILRDVPAEALVSGPFEADAQGLYRSLKDTVWMGYHLAAGDMLKPEAVSARDLGEMASFLSHRMNSDSFRVLLFHADSLTLSKYSDEDLEAVFDRFD